MAKQLTTNAVSRHTALIEAALARARIAFFDVVIAIKTARDELGDDLFQKELADRLSVSESTLSKYLQIADCAPLLKRQKTLPPRLTTLYTLAQTHSAYVKVRGAKRGEETFKKLLERVDKRTEASDVALALKKAKQQVTVALKKKREKKLLALSGSSASDVAETGELVSLTALIETKVVYRTIFIVPPDDVLKWVSDDGVFISDIAQRFPIADLRAPSLSETVQGFVYCAASHIEGGLKCLAAAGFQFRDIFFPSSSGIEGFDLLRSEKVLLRGERGMPIRPELNAPIEASEPGAVSIAEALGSPLRLYVFASHPLDGWTCSAQDQS